MINSSIWYRKLLIVLLLLPALCNDTFSQVSVKNKPQTVTDSVAAAMCSCITTYKDSIDTRQQLFTALQNCIRTCSVPHMDALLAEDGYVQQDDRKTRAAAVRAVGQKLGQKVSASCAQVKALIKKVDAEVPKKELH